MKIIYTLRGNNYNDDIAYDIDVENETITAKYTKNIRPQKDLEIILADIKQEKANLPNDNMATTETKRLYLQDKIDEVKELMDELVVEETEDTFDISVIEEGDRFEGVETDLPIDPIVDAYREDGELYVKLAWMPLKVSERIKRFGDKSYRVNVMEYEVV